MSKYKVTLHITMLHAIKYPYTFYFVYSILFYPIILYSILS